MEKLHYVSILSELVYSYAASRNGNAVVVIITRFSQV